MIFRQLVRNLRKDKQKEKEEMVVKRIAELVKKLENDEITGERIVQELDELLYNVRMDKLKR